MEQTKICKLCKKERPEHWIMSDGLCLDCFKAIANLQSDIAKKSLEDVGLLDKPKEERSWLTKAIVNKFRNRSLEKKKREIEERKLDIELAKLDKELKEVK